MLLFILLLQIACALSIETNETDNAISRKVLGSSVVTSVSVIMDTGNGTKTYFADAAGKPVPKPAIGSQLASPIILLNPDRYEFYTFNDSGNLIKRLMTMQEIQSIIATGDGDANANGQSLMDEIPDKNINDVVNNVQNVLKEEMKAHENASLTLSMLDTPDTSSNWDIILPAIFGNAGESATSRVTSGDSQSLVQELATKETPELGGLSSSTGTSQRDSSTVKYQTTRREDVQLKTELTTEKVAVTTNEIEILPVSTSKIDNLGVTLKEPQATTEFVRITVAVASPETTYMLPESGKTTTISTSPPETVKVTTNESPETVKITTISTSPPETVRVTTNELPETVRITTFNTPPETGKVTTITYPEAVEITTTSSKSAEAVKIISTSTEAVKVTTNILPETTVNTSPETVKVTTNALPETVKITTSTPTESVKLTTSPETFVKITTNTETVNPSPQTTNTSPEAVKVTTETVKTTINNASPETVTNIVNLTTHETTVSRQEIAATTEPVQTYSPELKNRYEEADLHHTNNSVVTTTEFSETSIFTSANSDATVSPILTSTKPSKTDLRLEDSTTTEFTVETTTDFVVTNSSTTTDESTTEIVKEETTAKSTPEFINISATTTKPKTVKPTEVKVISTQPPSTVKPDMTWTLVPTILPPKITASNEKASTTTQPVDLVPKPLQGFGLEDSTSTLDTDIFQFVELCNELAFNFWSSVTSGVSFARSVIVSPFAATSTLAMVFLGARGSTSGEMNEILKLDDMVTFNPHAMFKDVIDSIEVSKKSGVSVSVFVKELYSDKSKGKLLRFYKDRVKQFYDGHVEEADFGEISDVIRRRTNLLVKRHTWGKILEFIKDNVIVAQPPLAAISANIFQTDCSAASVEGRDGEIHFVVLPSIRQRKLIPIPAVVWRTGFLAGYDPALDATAVSIGTKEQTISVVFVIPGQQGISAPGDGLARLESRLIANAFRQGAWSRLLRSLIPRPGLEVQIPRFSHKSVINATVALQQMGLKDLFNASTADLKGLNGVPNELYLSDMIQINSFATCGEGKITENHHSEIYPATAARPLRKIRKLHNFENTDDLNALRDPLYDVGYLTLPLQLRPRQARLPEVPRLRFDRPFLYFVRHNPTGLILYVGRFNPRLLP